jgi:hypothetical protein
MLRATTMRLVAGSMIFALAASLAFACASEEGSIYDIDDGRPDASWDGAITPGTGGGPGFESCDPDFCPLTGPGAPCCVTGDGPCGMDNGLGCQQGAGPDN